MDENALNVFKKKTKELEARVAAPEKLTKALSGTSAPAESPKERR